MEFAKLMNCFKCSLQAIVTIKINKNIPRTIIIHTDSRITLESLKNTKKTKTSHRRN